MLGSRRWVGLWKVLLVIVIFYTALKKISLRGTR